jgi:hypothetical protein
MPEGAIHLPDRAQRHGQISRCRSQTFVSLLSFTRYADAPEGNCRKDVPRPLYCTKPAQGPSNAFKLLVSWKTRAGVTLSAAGRSEVDPAPVAAHLHVLEGVRKPSAGMSLGIQSNCLRSREIRSCVSRPRHSERAQRTRRYEKGRPRMPLHHSGIDGWIAVRAVRPQFGLCRSALHQGFADSQLLGRFAARPMSAAARTLLLSSPDHPAVQRRGPAPFCFPD